MPAHFAAIKADFESLKALPAPDVVFTHRRDDRHQDHRLIAELTWNTFRNHLILEYEVGEVRRRSHDSVGVHRAHSGARRTQDPDSSRLLPHAAQQALVHGRHLSRTDAPARHRIRRRVRLGRRLPRRQGATNLGFNRKTKDDLYRNGIARRIHSRPGEEGRRAGLLRPHVLPEGVRGAWTEARHRAGEHRFQRAQGHAARHAFPVSAGGGDQAGALHARRDSRHHRRPASRDRRPISSTCRSSSARTITGRCTCRSGSPTATSVSRTTRRRATRSASSILRPREGGLMYNDPRLGLKWPLPVTEISPKDAKWKLLDEVEGEVRRRMCGDRIRSTTDMIIVDNALKAREARRQADPGRHGRGRLHGSGPDQPDREPACPACAWRRSTTASRSARSASISTRASRTSRTAARRRRSMRRYASGRAAVRRGPVHDLPLA